MAHRLMVADDDLSSITEKIENGPNLTHKGKIQESLSIDTAAQPSYILQRSYILDMYSMIVPPIDLTTYMTY